MKKFFCAAAALAVTLALASCEKNTPDPADSQPKVDAKGYMTFEHGGFTYKMKASETATAAGIKAIDHLNKDLDKINEIIPEKALKVMKPHVIWLEKDLTSGAAWYHNGKEFLIQEGYMLEKWHCVELCNFVNYVNWSNQNQPCMVLHELCHLYHDLGLVGGFNNKDVLAAYNHAKSEGMYRDTPYRFYTTATTPDQWDYNVVPNSDTKAAYCMNNQMEYFSEMCEAYWGENDYYPFNREQLKEYDPQAFDLMEKIWK